MHWYPSPWSNFWTCRGSYCIDYILITLSHLRYFLNPMFVGVEFWNGKRHWIIIGSIILSASGVFGSFWNVYKVGKLSQITQLFPFLIFLSIMLAWPLILTNTTTSTYKLIYHFNGAVFAHTVSTVILAHLTKSPFPAVNPLQFVQVGVFIWSLFASNNHSVDTVLIYGLIVAIMWHAMIVLKVIGEICAHLKISCLTIPQTHMNKQL